MNIQKKQYVLSLSNLNQASLELVGGLARNIEQIQKLAINTPIGFVITSNAFDDFLIANDLLDYISPRINDIDYGDLGSVKKASKQIIEAIRNGPFPNILSEPIMQSYSGLAGFHDAYVSIRQSPIDPVLDITNHSPSLVLTSISGKEKLLAYIKEYWSMLFTPEALLYRGEKSYEGYLSEALVVQKMLQTESGGKMYTYNTFDQTNEVIEIQTFFGLYEPTLWKELTPDSYFVHKKSEEILEKKIVGQEWMFVRKGKNGDKSPLSKIQISKLWQNKQKLDDKYILALSRYGKLIAEQLKAQLEIEWGYEGGRLYIISFRIKGLEHNDEEISVYKSNDVMAPEAMSPTLGNVGVNAGANSSTGKKSMDQYLDEVQKIRDQSLSSAVGDDASKVVVEIKPIEELHLLTQGEAYGNGTIFGLVHFAFSPKDYEDLTGDEVVVVRKIDADFVSVLNSVKAVIVQNPVSPEEFGLIKVPLIAEVEDAFDLLRESEVVTMRMWNGGIYLGAGKDVEMPEAEEHKIAEVKAVSPEEVVSAEKQKYYNHSSDLAHGKLAEQVSQEPLADDELSAMAVNEETEPKLQISKETMPKTVLDFWQVYFPGQAEIDLKNIDGLVVRVADLIEKYDKQNFGAELSEQLTAIAQMADGKPVIVVSAGRGKMIETLVEAELLVVAKLRNHEMLRNIWYCFDNVGSPDELLTLKKLFTSKGFRRSSTFKLYLNVHSPQSIISLKGMLDNDVDGVIIDTDLFSREHGLTAGLQDQFVSKYLVDKIAEMHEVKATSIILATEEVIDEKVLKELIRNGLNSIALGLEQIYKLKPITVEIEATTKSDRKIARGRKRKEIDFGF